MNNKSFLLVYSRLSTGGVETLIVRMANWLVKRQHNVRLLLMDKADLDLLLDEKVLVKYFDSLYYLLYNPLYNKRVVKDDFFKGIDYIYSFESTTCMLACLIHKNLSLKPGFFTGIYQPNEFFSSEKAKTRFFPKEIRQLISKVIAPESLLFMNEGCKQSVESNFKMKFNNSFFPLPVELPHIVAENRERPKGNIIVSIGRITYFKTYTFTMLDIIGNLKKRGINLLYKIYGHGPLEEELVNKINEYDLTDMVQFHGKLKYDKMSEAFSEAFLFIGMGTSVIEASGNGVPSLLAIFKNPRKACYGYFYNYNGYNVGEIDHDQQEYNIEDLILDALNWSDEEYKMAVKKSIQKAITFNIDNVMEGFINYISSMENPRLNYLSDIIHNKFFFQSIVPKLLKRILKRVLRK